MVTHALSRLPDRQLAPLLAAYARVMRARRVWLLGALAALGLCAIIAARVADVDVPKLLQGMSRVTEYFDRIFRLESGGRVWSDPAEWFWGWRKWLRLLADTILIAYIGTVFGAVGAFCLSFLAAHNLGRAPWLRFGVRRLFEFCRTVPELVFALIFVVSFGLGPLPGVLALAIHSLGSLGKLFTEIIENIDLKPVQGLESTGAGFVPVVRFAVVPQVLSNFISYALLRFEINVRGAAVMGFVGAGGIGQDLIEAVRKFYYSDVSAILVMIVATVFLIDMATSRLRHSLLQSVQRP